MKLVRQHRRCHSSQVVCLLMILKQTRIDLNHLISRMTDFIQILMMYHLEWHVVTRLMVASIPTKTQGKHA